YRPSLEQSVARSAHQGDGDCHQMRRQQGRSVPVRKVAVSEGLWDKGACLRTPLQAEMLEWK
ncbi:hypothetical protein HAX54_049744, partial [Datura stramonium]|nr:hypothetical protein [Datura stramonium]